MRDQSVGRVIHVDVELPKNYTFLVDSVLKYSRKGEEEPEGCEGDSPGEGHRNESVVFWLRHQRS